MYKILSCSVFENFIADIIPLEAQSDFDIEYIEMKEHNVPEKLRDILQNKIDNLGDEYEAVVLLYGICGNASNGIRANNTPLIIPRMHDCGTMFLGHKNKYQDLFKDRPSMSWSSLYYYQENLKSAQDSEEDLLPHNMILQECIEKYGEENGTYVYETLYPQDNDLPFLYINFSAEEDKDVAEQLSEDQERMEYVCGSSRLLEMVFAKNFDEDDFLIVHPKERIKAIYDYEKILTVASKD